MKPIILRLKELLLMRASLLRLPVTTLNSGIAPMHSSTRLPFSRRCGDSRDSPKGQVRGMDCSRDLRWQFQFSSKKRMDRVGGAFGRGETSCGSCFEHQTRADWQQQYSRKCM